MKTLLVIALLALATGCAGTHTAAPSTFPPATVATNATPPSATTTPADLFSQGYQRTKADFAKVSEIAIAAHEAVGMQCGADASAFFNVADHIADTTGYFFADIEQARVAQSSNIVVLFQKFSDSCSPLLMGPAKFVAAIHLPGNIAKLLNGAVQ